MIVNGALIYQMPCLIKLLESLCITNPDSTKDECHGPQLGVKGVKFMKIDL